MPETHLEVTKVWIAPGCIVCDSCENDCPEVFDVQEQTCIIRPPAMSVDFVRTLTQSIQVAAEGCPVDVIKFDTKEVEGPAPWTNQPVEASSHAAAGAPAGVAVAAKVAAPLAPPDPRWQAMLSSSHISQSRSATAPTPASISHDPQVVAGTQILAEARVPHNAPADMRIAALSVGGGYMPSTPLADIIRKNASAKSPTRRGFNIALIAGWGALAACTATFGAMFQDFFGPKVLKEPKKVYRVGTLDDYGNIDSVYEQFKPVGIWMVNLMPMEPKLIALSTICTHLGCIPNWLAAENKFKCPCHGSGYYITGINFEGPTPRPLERFAITKDADGFVVVDMSRTYRYELGDWDNPESFIPLA
jgi:cytochrome b6-f complex iron-sulfur subunit